MSDINPMAQIEVENEIRRLSGELNEQTQENAVAAEEAARADVEYDLAKARALLQVPRIRDGEKLTVAEREAIALVTVGSEYEDARLTEAIYKATQERGRNLRTQLDALRTIAANVRAAVDYSYGRGMRSGKNTDRPVTLHKDLRPYFDAAIAAGWTWRFTGNGHIRITSPEGVGISMAATPRNGYRSARNLQRDLRRAGVDV
jgi:hypothetical protein